ncbi:MAG: alanine--glyoxylate aminotransferase family protein [Spirochaetia bacterium]|jgi:aspartate aminotransferase-like enzyme
MPHKKLFIPGPTEVHPDVLKAMSTPMIGHRSSDYSELQKRITEKTQKIAFTVNPILFSASSGSGLMEGAIRCCTAKRAIVFSVGTFGNRWFEIAQGNGVPADKHEVEWGQGLTPEMIDQYLSTGKYDCATLTHSETSTGVMNPLSELAPVFRKYPDVVWCIDAVSSFGGVRIDNDALGIDVMVTSSQKCLGLPPGLSLATISPKAEKRAQSVKNRGYYFDLLQLLQFIREKNFQYPSTMSISHLFALDLQLDRIAKEGLDARFTRHQMMARRVQDWAKKHFALYPAEKYASTTVTCIKNTRGISVADLNKELGKRNLTLSNGYGKLKEQTFRIAHMGDLQMSDIDELLEAIEEILRLR